MNQLIEMTAIKEPKRQRMMRKLEAEIVVASTTILAWIGMGTVTFHKLETLTTVGYGDLVPTRDATRLFVAIYILFGVSMVVAALGIIGNELTKRRRDEVFAHQLNGSRKKRK